MASSLQLELSSNVELANIGAVVRLATEAAPTKAEAQASKGHLSVRIPADATRKISISQHYGSIFSDGLTIADVLTPNTAYKLYLYFPAEISTTTAEITGLSITNDIAVVSFTTAMLPAAGHAVWGTARANKQFVASLSEWGYSENQKGVFIAYIQLPNPFNGTTFSTRISLDNRLVTSTTIGSFAIGLVESNSQFLFNMLKLGGSYPDTDNYYYVIAADNTEILPGKFFDLETTTPSATLISNASLTRY
ncbi:hypothetical protein P0082_11750 [Candidatus Haliotispira prima]|uniref:Uncharacterized protein n=1 Tax=Candidatus Haliotispira prima TaxID=3034016 RepID=A0ABY8MGP1_9SPIO|nr:hypothetical protein P0082_11750 [Candidatus Haliotispira prima]